MQTQGAHRPRRPLHTCAACLPVRLGGVSRCGPALPARRCWGAVPASLSESNTVVGGMLGRSSCSWPRIEPVEITRAGLLGLLRWRETVISPLPETQIVNLSHTDASLKTLARFSCPFGCILPAAFQFQALIPPVEACLCFNQRQFPLHQAAQQQALA